MKKLFVSYSSLFPLFLLASYLTYGQHLSITTYYSKDGAPVMGANSVMQDNNGWMWFTNGLEAVRYDGNRFKSYYPSAACNMNYCFGTLQVNNEIWVMAQPYLLKVAGDSLVPLDISNNGIDLVHALQYKNKQFILEKRGLYILNRRELQKDIVDTSLYIWDDASLIPFADSLLLAYELRRSLVVFNLNQHSFSRIALPVFDMKQDDKGRTYLFVKDKGLLLLKNLVRSGDTWKTETELFASPEYNYNQIGSFLIDRRGNFWLYEQFKSLIKISPEKKLSRFSESNGLPGLWFFRMIMDKEDNLWLALHGAISKINQTSFERFTSNEGLCFNHVSFMRSEEGGFTYIGTQRGLNIYSNGKLHRLRSGTHTFYCSFLVRTGKRIYYTRDSAFWTAVMDTGKYYCTSEKFLSPLPGLGVELAIDKRGTIFIATNRGLCGWYKNRLFELLPTIYHRKMLIDSKNRLWLGQFSGGLSCYEINYQNGQPVLKLLIDVNENKSGLPVSRIRAVAEDREGNIVVGTRFNGLFYLSLQQNILLGITNFMKKDGLRSNTIWSLATDSRGNIWVGNELGLNKLSRHEDKLIVTDESKQTQIYSTYQVTCDRDQSLWISNFPGIVKLNTSAVVPTRPFSVFITNVIAEGNPIQLKNEQKNNPFVYQQNTFIIEFSSNSFLDEKAIGYSYRLVKNGAEKWSEPLPVHQVNYSSLLPGRYQFQIKAFNINGEWSNNTTSYSFEILPPFWQQSWFIIGAAFLVLLGMYLLYRSRIGQILHLQEMRNNISRNLHDDIGASLTNINILNELSNRNINDPAKAGNYLHQAAEDIQRISEALSDIVWNINPRYDKIGNLFACMKRYAADMMDGRQIETELNFPADENNLQLPMDKRRDLYLIFKEAVNNLVKYSGASEAIVEVKIGSSKIVLRIEDNGVGFHTRNNDKGNGLYNMQQRAKRWNAPLHIISEPGKGTKVILEMKT